MDLKPHEDETDQAESPSEFGACGNAEPTSKREPSPRPRPRPINRPTPVLPPTTTCTNFDQVEKKDTVYYKIADLDGSKDVAEEDLVQITIQGIVVHIHYDERLNLPDNGDIKKRLKDKILENNKGKLIIDYKRSWSVGRNSYNLIPADMIVILRDEDDLTGFKHTLVSFFKKRNFTVDIRPINGGESVNFESSSFHTQDNKFINLRVPMKIWNNSPYPFGFHQIFQ